MKPHSPQSLHDWTQHREISSKNERPRVKQARARMVPMIETTVYRTRLEEESGALEKELLSIGRRNPSNANDWEAVPPEVGQESDPNDRADLIAHFEDNTAILKDL